MFNKISLLIAIICLILFFSTPAFAPQDVGVNENAEVEMDIQLTIPSHVTLRIGSGGTVIDTVIFNVTGTPRDMPVVTSDISPQVEISTNVDSGITLVVDSSSGLSGGPQPISFGSISWQGTGAFEGSDAAFDGSANQTIKSFSGRGTHSGSFIFSFQNKYEYQPGTYAGTVIYTVTSP